MKQPPNLADLRPWDGGRHRHPSNQQLLRSPERSERVLQAIALTSAGVFLGMAVVAVACGLWRFLQKGNT